MAAPGAKSKPHDMLAPPRKPYEQRQRDEKLASLPHYELADLDMPPALMGEEVAKVWDELAPVFKGRGVITEADMTLFCEICSIIADMRKYKEKIELQGLTVDGSGGGTVKHPLISPLNTLRGMLRGYLCELGWTPGSRTKIARATTEEDIKENDPFADLMKRSAG